jgi:hypothetical protein
VELVYSIACVVIICSDRDAMAVAVPESQQVVAAPVGSKSMSVSSFVHPLFLLSLGCR